MIDLLPRHARFSERARSAPRIFAPPRPRAAIFEALAPPPPRPYPAIVVPVAGDLVQLIQQGVGRVPSVFIGYQSITPPPPGPGITQRHLTANYAILDTDNNVYFDNQGAISEVDATLPISPAAAQVNGFFVTVGQNLGIVAPAGVVIGVGTQSTSPGGSVISNLPDSSLLLYAVSATRWVSTSTSGSWTVN